MKPSCRWFGLSAAVLGVLAAGGAAQLGTPFLPTALYSWGQGGSGQTGDGQTVSRWTAVRIGVPDVTSAACGEQHSTFLKRDGTVWGCGSNNANELGDGSPADGHTTPAPMPGITRAVSVAAGEDYTLILLADGTMQSCGANTYGQLGHGNTGGYRPPLGPVVSLADAAAISAGSQHAVALKADGTVWVWGRNWVYELGTGTSDNQPHPVPQKVPGLTDVVAVSAGGDHTLALKSDGTVWGWGQNNDRESCPDVQTMRVGTPSRVSALVDVVAVSAGYRRSLALKRDGTVWEWGVDNTTNGSMGAPQLVTGLPEIVQIAAGGCYGLALAKDGAVWAWGLNHIGQCGDGVHTSPRQPPVKVVGLTPALSIHAGLDHSFAVCVMQTAQYRPPVRPVRPIRPMRPIVTPPRRP